MAALQPFNCVQTSNNTFKCVFAEMCICLNVYLLQRFTMTDTHKESLSGHDNAVLNKIFNPNMPFDDSVVESSSQFEPDRKFLNVN